MYGVQTVFCLSAQNISDTWKIAIFHKILLKTVTEGILPRALLILMSKIKVQDIPQLHRRCGYNKLLH